MARIPGIPTARAASESVVKTSEWLSGGYRANILAAVSYSFVLCVPKYPITLCGCLLNDT